MRCRKGENEFQPESASFPLSATAANLSLGAAIGTTAPVFSSAGPAKQHLLHD